MEQNGTQTVRANLVCFNGCSDASSRSQNRRAKLIIFVVMAVLFFGLHIYLYWIKKWPYELSKVKKGE